MKITTTHPYRPIKGSVEVNGKVIEEFKSGRLLIGKEANLSVPEGTI